MGLPEFLSTHPSNDTRIEDLNKLLPEAKKYYAKSNKAKNNPIPNLDKISQGTSSEGKTEIKMKVGN